MNGNLRRLIPKHFSLRLLLLIVAVSGAYFAVTTNGEFRRQAIVNSIQSNGGSVVVGGAHSSLFTTANIVRVQIPQTALAELSNNDLRRFPKLEQVTILGFSCQTGVQPTNIGTITALNAPEWTISASRIELLDELRQGPKVDTARGFLEAIVPPQHLLRER